MSVHYAIERFSPRYAFFRSIAETARILDVGCGFGRNAKIIWHYHPLAVVDGVDILPPEFVESAIRYRRCDVLREKLPYPDATFDQVIIAHLVEHLPDMGRVMAEARRVVKPDGTIYVETPSPVALRLPSLPYLAEQGGPTNFFDDRSHVRLVDRRMLAGAAAQAGLTIVRSGRVRNIPKLALDPLILLLGALVRRRALMTNAIWNLTGWSSYFLLRRTENGRPHGGRSE